jgi:hypothetical protein
MKVPGRRRNQPSMALRLFTVRPGKAMRHEQTLLRAQFAGLLRFPSRSKRRVARSSPGIWMLRLDADNAMDGRRCAAQRSDLLSATLRSCSHWLMLIATDGIPKKNDNQPNNALDTSIPAP